ncbi:MAG: arylesterase [Alphaproteobacteria bacterium]|nr:arylesterase [Alphaproteobacteria bacterium]
MRPETSQRYGPFRPIFNLYALLLLAVLCWAPPAAADDALQVLALGDSLTAGYGLPQDKSFPAQLQKALRDDGLDVTVHNAGVSGDTASGGLTRLDWALAGVNGKPDLVIVELGANDALRGVDPHVTSKALSDIIDRLKRDGIPVLLAGMKAPPNMGEDYVKRFDNIYPVLAQVFDVPLYPFFLDGVAGNKALNQTDGMHPTAEGVAIIVKRMEPVLLGLLAPEAAHQAAAP